MELERRGWRSVFVISDRGVASAGLLARLEGLLQEKGVPYRIFLDVQTNPSAQTVLSALEELKDA